MQNTPLSKLSRWSTPPHKFWRRIQAIYEATIWIQVLVGVPLLIKYLDQQEELHNCHNHINILYLFLVFWSSGILANLTDLLPDSFLCHYETPNWGTSPIVAPIPVQPYLSFSLLNCSIWYVTSICLSHTVNRDLEAGPHCNPFENPTT